MTPRKRTTKTPGSPSRRYERLKDEVYRQMYRLEASRPGAELALAIALLRAWTTLDTEADMPKPREWLMKICPVCLPMIEAAQKVREVEKQCIQ
jgi:DNA-directed RNA polymerase specialized sigma24 family protein